MQILDAIRSAVRALRSEWLRTVLTLFGLVWGTASVVFLLSWGAGTKVMLEEGYTKVGKNLVQVWAGRIGEDFTPAADRRHLWFTRKHVDLLRQKSRLADLAAGEVSRIFVVSFGQKTQTTNVRGVEPVARELRGVSLESGRNLREGDLSRRSRVAVIGAKIRRELLGPSGRVGSRIRIGGHSYEVVGILKEVGTQFWQDGGFLLDEQIWVPITTLMARQPDWEIGEPIVSSILLRLEDRKNYDALMDEVRAILAPSLGVSPTDKEAVMIGSPIDGLRNLPLDGLDFVLYVLGATTLGIGGIGILSMMLDAVQERRREIGIRLAVGARRRDILLQFFLETFSITAIGGLAGVALGVICCWLMDALAVPGQIPGAILTSEIIAVALITMIFVGLVSGTVPAWRASRVDPSISLRSD
jgi:putative ABC transport system permease protein